MDAPDKRLTKLVVLGLVILLAIGVWQGYGAWALDAVTAHVG
jgi:hypothetical protein